MRKAGFGRRGNKRSEVVMGKKEVTNERHELAEGGCRSVAALIRSLAGKEGK